ncbi:MAG: thiol reductant ABC exporter subunit CydD [Hyphomicrobiaceae bacterium]
MTAKAGVDKRTIAQFLNALRPSAARPLRLSVTAAIANGLLVILQAYILAGLIVRLVIDHQPLDAAGPSIAAFVAIVLARTLLSWCAEALAIGAAANVQNRLRADLVAHLRRLGPVGLGGQPTGETVSAISDGLRAIEPYFARYLPASWLAALLPLAVLAAVAPFDWLSALVFIVTAPLIPLFMMLIGSGAETLNQRQWRTLTRLSGRLLDTIQGLTTLKLFNATGREFELVETIAERYRIETMSILRVAFLSSLALEFFATVSIAIVAVLVGFRLLWGEIPLFNGLFVLLLAPEFYLPMRTLGSAYHARMEAIGAAERMVALLAMAPPGAPPQTSPLSTAAPLPDVPRSIRLHAVSVAFDDGRVAVRDLDLEIARGERIALVGPSGGGKSTIVALLMGFLWPTKGHVLLDGTSMDTIDLAAWRRHITFVPQHPHLFEGSIRENIAMSFDGAAIDEAAIAAAAHEACLGEVIAALPDGYDTIVGERGYGLSGGEVQRLALARAFYRKAPIVIVDEPTAHLDAETEGIVAEAVQRLAEGRTLILVAHRRALLPSMDRVIVVAGGRVVRSGSAAEIMASDSAFDVEPAGTSPIAAGA